MTRDSIASTEVDRRPQDDDLGPCQRVGESPRRPFHLIPLQVARVERVALAKVTRFIAAAKPADALFGCAVSK